MSILTLVTFLGISLMLFGQAIASRNYSVDSSLFKYGDSINNLATTLYSDGQYVGETDTTNYFVINQCSKSTASHKYVQLNIICPGNPILNSSGNDPYVVIELSKCKDNWDPSTCLIGVNYVWSSHPTIYTNVTWIYETQPDDIYVRYRSYNRKVGFSILVTYTNYASVNLGKYTNGVIPGTTANNGNYEALRQYVKSTDKSTVTNFNAQVFYFDICSRYAPYNSDYSIIASVVSTTDKIGQLSAFDLVGCAYSNTPDYNDCTTANLDSVKDQDASALVQIIMNNDESMDLTQGVWLVVYGQGGNPDGLNSFVIDVTVTPQITLS